MMGDSPSDAGLAFMIATMSKQLDRLQEQLDVHGKDIKLLLDARSKATGIWIGISAIFAGAGTLFAMLSHFKW